MENDIFKKIYLKSLKQDILKAKYPPAYHIDQRFYDESFGFNCYAYAMQFKTGYIKDSEAYPYNPGYISQELNPMKLKYNRNNLINNFLDDCQVLGIQCQSTSFSDDVNSDEYKIAILLGEDTYYGPDFHFVRQNGDLMWSEMKYCCGPVVKTIIENESDFYMHFDQYSLVDLVKVKKLIKK